MNSIGVSSPLPETPNTNEHLLHKEESSRSFRLKNRGQPTYKINRPKAKYWQICVFLKRGLLKYMKN